MPKRPSSVTLPLDARIRDSERRATSMTLPVAVLHRLDVLAELASDVNASRAEIIAMLITEADLDVTELERLVLAYRKKRVEDVIPMEPDRSAEPGGQNIVTLPMRQVGRPPSRTSRSPRPA